MPAVIVWRLMPIIGIIDLEWRKAIRAMSAGYFLNKAPFLRYPIFDL